MSHPSGSADETARPALVLASASPRRRDLLRQIGVVPDAVISADIDEEPRPGELPRPLSERLARGKAAHVATAYAGSALILGADTVVAVGRRVLPKAETEAEARRCLALLSGRRHKVITTVVLQPTPAFTTAFPQAVTSVRVVESTVIFARLTADHIDALIAQGDWSGKAGGYAIQGAAASHIRQIGGSYSAVVGLPLFETAQLLRGQPRREGGWIP